MKYKPKGTLAYFKSAPQFHRVQLAHLPTKYFAASTKKYRKDCGQVSPDTDAITFYALNHLSSIVEKYFTLHEPLPSWALDVRQAHLDEVSKQGNRVLHYILSICTREMRHLKTTTLPQKFWTTVEKDYGLIFKEFLNSICVVGETEAVNKYMNTPPEVPLGKFIGGLAYAFHNGKWAGGYGGKKWGEVADACGSFVQGKTSMEALVDTGYTLAHNNGPIFNKGMMYEHYSGHFNMILDIQRSGQIPELILDKKSYGINKSISAEVEIFVKKAQVELPKEFRGWVDWFQVEKLGAMGKYSEYKEQQKKEHPTVIEPPKPVITTVKIGKTVEKFKEIGNFEVYPGEIVKKVERVYA